MDAQQATMGQTGRGPLAPESTPVRWVLRAAGVLAPLALGCLASVLGRTGVLVFGGNLDPALGLLLLVGVGLLSGLLIGRWWAAVAAPAAFVGGLALVAVVTEGMAGLAQGAPGEVAALASLLVLTIVGPIALGGFLGFVLRLPRYTRRTPTSHAPSR